MIFEETDLDNRLKRALKEYDYINMTSIQEKTLDKILDFKDVVASSNTGSGKTLAYLLPLINNIDIEKNSTQVLIVVPTRELAIQIVQVARKMLKYYQGINTLAIYGGQEIKMQAISLRKGVKIVVGTPGRILDLLKKKTFKMPNLKAIVLDEADESLKMGFINEIKSILEYAPENVQKLLFSATLNEEISNLINDSLKEPEFVECKENNSLVVNNIKEYAIDVKEKMKNEVVVRLIKNIKPKNSIVFCNTKKKTEDVCKYLQIAKIKAEMLNSDIRQEEREKIFKKLKNGLLDTIVVTDVLSRGIDVKDLELVINYDIPFEKEYYIHRIGRTARNNNSGVAYTLYTGKQIDKLKEIEEYAKTKIEVVDIPLRKEENFDISYPKTDRGLYTVTFSLGKQDGIKAKDIVGALSALTGLDSIKIGKIDVMESTSTVEVPKEYIQDVDRVFSHPKAKIKKIPVKILK